jgi:hypothetical protein
MFKGLLVQKVLDDLEQAGVSVRAVTEAGALQRLIPLEDFAIPVRRSAMYALPAYLAFFCLENSVRELVSERLSEFHGPDWWSSDGVVGVRIRQKVEQRQEKEGRERWHAQRGAHNIQYTDFGDLKSLITNNFADFEDLFPDQNWISSRLDELEASRNIIAHSNVLESREMDRIRLYLQDWIRQVG